MLVPRIKMPDVFFVMLTLGLFLPLVVSAEVAQDTNEMESVRIVVDADFNLSDNGITNRAEAIEEYSVFNYDNDLDKFGMIKGIKMARQAAPLGEVDLSEIGRLRVNDISVLDIAREIIRMFWQMFYFLILKPLIG